jgi:SAM-dependent methyltransferase
MAARFHARDHLRPQVSTEYQLDWCAGCAFGCIAGNFTPAMVSDFYTEGYYTHVASGTEQETKRRMLDRIRVHLAWRTDRGIDLSPREVQRAHNLPTLCDVGCGSGQAMSAFRSAGYDVVGIEPDAAARRLAEQTGTVYEGTAETLPDAITGRAFDAVLLSHVLEHCIDPAAALGNVKRLLAPAGTAIIEVPNNAATGFELYGPGWFFADIPRHLQFFTERSLDMALARAGLRVTRAIYTGYTRQFAPEWLAAQEQIRRNAELDRSGANKSAWGLLARTAFASPSRKYDSIRVHAVHREADVMASISR